MEPLVNSLPVLVKGLGATADDALHAAVAVTTTDLVSKSAALEVRSCLYFPLFFPLSFTFLFLEEENAQHSGIWYYEENFGVMRQESGDEKRG